MSAKRQKIKNTALIIIFWGVLIVSFIFFSALIILKANGYELNYKTRHFTKTGMIVLEANPEGTLILDGRNYKKQGFPAKISSLSPGAYNIEITAPNYQSWEKTIAVNTGQASVYDHILLYKIAASDTNAPAGLTLDELTAEAKNYQGNILFTGSEIIYSDILVTRFSQNVLAAALAPDDYHIVFQVGNQVRVIDIDGSNNKLLFELPNDQPTQLSFRDHGNIVIYFDNVSMSTKGKIVR